MDGATPTLNPASPPTPRHAIEIARTVLRTEGEALMLFADQINPQAFQSAVDAILAIEGRVIVSGMGKSGHVGKKIAATLASTGTPAQFVHPAEASHGDLGMVTSKDLALVLSNSGETPELTDLITHTRRFGAPLIGVASRPESALMRAADIRLTLPRAPEACPMGLAPTTSTTLTLALGDALAVALMDRRRFTQESFRQFHPGGKLGAKLLTVRALMHGPEALPLVGESAPMTEAILQMTQKSFGVTGVLDQQGRLIGVVTDGDLRRHIKNITTMTAGEAATNTPRTIQPDSLAAEALAKMNDPQRPITCLFVTETADGAPERPVGLIHVHDCLRAGVA